MVNQRIGKKGEDLAARYLTNKGYQIIARNYRTPYGEIDIICRFHKVIIFVEVKTRTNKKYGLPEEAVTYKKKEHVRKAALAFLDSYDKPFGHMRFDVLGILLLKEHVHIEHIESAF